jgi:hypothetical protein
LGICSTKCFFSLSAFEPESRESHFTSDNVSIGVPRQLAVAGQSVVDQSR